MSQSFEEDCRSRGGRLKQTANGLVCRITGNNNKRQTKSHERINPGGGSNTTNSTPNPNSSNWLTESALSLLPSFVNTETRFAALVILLGGLAVSGGMKAYGMAYLIDHVGVGVSFVPALIATFIPVIPYFVYHGFPQWFWYSAAWSWMGDVIAILLIWEVMADESGLGLVASGGLGAFAFANTVASTVLAYALSLTTVNGFTQSNFWQLFLVSRLSIAGLLFPLTTSNLFQFSQITWAVVVVLMLLKFGGMAIL